jgi:hypothetical protein
VKIILSYILLLFTLVGGSLQAQENDSLRNEIRKDSIRAKRAVRHAIYGNARKATIMSAIVPGLGQVYNGRKSIWKVPVIYAALGGVGYWGFTNQVKYKYYSNNLKYIYDEDESTVNETLYDANQLITQKNYYKKYRDMAIMIGSLVYLINIIDANVDAHLKKFDVSDDLSLQFKPYTGFDYNNKLLTGISIKLNFK